MIIKAKEKYYLIPVYRLNKKWGYSLKLVNEWKLIGYKIIPLRLL